MAYLSMSGGSIVMVVIFISHRRILMMSVDLNQVLNEANGNQMTK